MPGIRPRIAPTVNYGIVGTNIYTDVIQGATQLMGQVQQGIRDKSQAEFRREGLDLEREKFEEQKKNQVYINELREAQAAALEKKQTKEIRSDHAAQQAGRAMRIFNAGEALVPDQTPSSEQSVADQKLINEALGGVFDGGEFSLVPTKGGYNLTTESQEAYNAFVESFGPDIGEYVGQDLDGKFSGKTITGMELGALGRGIVANMDRSDNPAAYDKAFNAMDTSITDPQKRAETGRDLYSTSVTKMVKKYEDSRDDFKKDVRNAGMSPEMMQAGLKEIDRRHEEALTLARDAYDKADDKLQGAYDFQSTYHIQNVQTQRIINASNDLGSFVRGESVALPAFEEQAAAYQKFVINKKNELISLPTSDRAKLAESMQEDLDGVIFPNMYKILYGNGSQEGYAESPMNAVAQGLKVKLNDAIMNPTAARPKLSAEESRLYHAGENYLSPYFGTFPVMDTKQIKAYEAGEVKLPKGIQNLVKEATTVE